jgi:apolipoprotein N-acyltransferase
MGITLILIALSVGLLLAGFAPINAYLLGFFALVPLLFLLVPLQRSNAQNKVKKSALIGFLFGFLYMAVTHLWLFQLLEFSSLLSISLLFIVYSLALALFYASASLVFVCFTRSLWMFPFIWVAFEYLRSIGKFGNPNGVIGYSQATNTWLLSYASISSVALVSFVILCLNCVIYYGLDSILKRSFNKRLLALNAILVVIIFVMPVFFQWPKDSVLHRLSVSLIQGNHKQSDKFNPSERQSIKQDYFRLSLQEVETHKPELIIWPETFCVGLNLESRFFIKALNQLETPVLFGSARYDDKRYYNSAVLYKNNSMGIYDKNQLMPFGEYWPYKSLFRFFGLSNIIPGAEYSFGAQPQPLQFNNLSIGLGICLESLYAKHFLMQRLNGADLFVVMANGAWFKQSSINERHLHMGLVRAVENGVPFIQCSNIGLSAFVSAEGKILHVSTLKQQQVLHESLSWQTINTPYLIVGQGMALFSVGLMLLLCLKGFVGYLSKKMSVL